MGKPPSTLKQVTKTLAGIYGSSVMCRGLAKHIDENIVEWADKADDDFMSTEAYLRNQIWNWFSGGDTAAYAAKEVMKIYGDIQLAPPEKEAPRSTSAPEGS